MKKVHFEITNEENGLTVNTPCTVYIGQDAISVQSEDDISKITSLLAENYQLTINGQWLITTNVIESIKLV
jgi:hypothetical protein